MRSLFSVGTRLTARLVSSGSGQRPEQLRRRTIGSTARLALVAVVLLLPFSVFAMVKGTPTMLIVSVIGAVGAMVSLVLHGRQQFEAAVAAQVGAVLLVGTLLTLVDPRLGDVGFAIALMGPILAALLARSAVRWASWAALGGIVVLAAAAALNDWTLLSQASPFVMPVGSGAFVVVVALVAYSANRINAAYEVNDRAQINAFRHLVEHVQDAVFRFSAAGEVLLASRSSETLFGCPRYVLTGTALTERLHVQDRPAYLSALHDASRGGKTRLVEVRMRQDRTGATVPSFIWVEVSLSPVLEAGEDEDGGFEVVALFRDITDRKDSEQRMEQARVAAEEASSAKSRFLATIGHELRTPLNAVVGFSEMMTSGIGGELSDTHREYAGLIHQSGRHLLEVVGMLLDMSRIEAGKFELQTEAFAPGALVEPCLAMVDPLARDRQVTVSAKVAPDLPMVLADERACRQIVLNLLSNAVKFSHPGGQVDMLVKRQGQYLNISVHDGGIGMAPDALGRIGEAFFQANDGLARTHEGTGLGLSIVKGLVDLHHGNLRAVSELGQGTSVTVLLPINGPAINNTDTATVTPLHREPMSPPIDSWQDEKRKAQ